MTGRTSIPRGRATWFALGGLLLIGAAVAGVMWWQRAGQEPAGPPAGQPVNSEHARRTRHVIIGGGGLPESNEVQIEQDVLLAREVFGTDGRILFAGGAGSHGVQVRGRPVASDSVRGALAMLFSPRRGRDSTYRQVRAPAQAPATKSRVTDALKAELAAERSDPLLVLVAGHGDRGEQPKDNVAILWGQGTLSVTELAALLDKAPGRPVTAVVTTCFSGGFAELAFQGADPGLGPAVQDRCGLFAAPWDLEAAGCDPDPDRRRQQGYGLHFLNALQGRDREGRPLAPHHIDYDGNGRISYLEAHTRVRIASKAADVPTTTSERWLRYIGPQEQAAVSVAMPEEDAVVAGLGAALGLENERSGDVASARYEALQTRIMALEIAIDEAKKKSDDAYYDVLADVLSRWPVIDDPWHPDFEATLSKSRTEIATWLQKSEVYRAYLNRLDALDALDIQLQNLRLKAAPLERFIRAVDNRVLASRLKARGGAEWAVYERLLACERREPGAAAP